MKFSKVYEPRISEYDKNGNLSVKSIIGILEDAGAKHSTFAGNDILECRLNGYTWILVEWNVEINRLPKNNQKLLVETWAVFKKPEIITSREFEIKDEQGNVFIHACERLVYEDLQNGKLVRITPEMMGNYNPEPELQHTFRFAKLKEPAVYDREKPLAVRITDIDFNDHVHNTVYFDYALDMLENTQEFISGFRILYKKPLMYKDTATVKIANTDGGYTVGIYKEDVLCTLVEIRK
ncbi:MAG: thioesterase [Acutalibacteraceae bacterium]|nr:thioesterase [Acutalibacteraceae bacterium]